MDLLDSPIRDKRTACNLTADHRQPKLNIRELLNHKDLYGNTTDLCKMAENNIVLSIKDTTHFLNKLQQLGQLPNNAILVTLDVSSLYTNIPHNEGINACRHFLETRNRTPSTISSETLCDLIRMILTMNNFTFNDKHYLQTHGIAMGTQMAPSYTNLFLAKFETDALLRAPFQPYIWWRVIDDIFMIRTHSLDDLQTFTTYLNNIHPTIKFTSNYSLTSIPFLDVSVSLYNGTITTDLYTKPTDKHQYLLQSSCHPRHTKRAIPFSLAL